MTHLDCLDISLLREEDHARLYRAASPQRQARADRFRNREDALRCLAAEALLRRGARLAGIPEGFALMQEPGEKPFLPDHPDFHFSISHSGTWVVLAWGDSPVGVDVERIDESRPLEALAKRYFSPDEQEFAKIHGPEGFYQIWTAKESYVKYLGTGLTIPLPAFSILSLPQPQFFRHPLPGGYTLTLCAGEDAPPKQVGI